MTKTTEFYPHVFYTESMYDVGSKIDLTYLNRKPVIHDAPAPESRWYDVGSKVVFVKLQTA